MSVATGYKVYIPFSLIFIGIALVCGVAIGESGVARYLTFAGAIMVAAGYFFQRLTYSSSQSAQKS